MRVPKQEEKILEYEMLSLPEKRKRLGKEIAEMTFITEKLIHSLWENYEVKPMKEYDNLFDETTSEEVYLDGLYEDLLDLQETMGLYYDAINSGEDMK